MSQARREAATPSVEAFIVGAGRAFAGALTFALPMLMTMEMWWLGFYVEPLRLATLLASMLPMLLVLSHFAGFRQTERLRDDVADALVVIAVAFLTALLVLTVLGVITRGDPLDDIIKKVALQAFPASIGAMLARSMLGADSGVREFDEASVSYGGEIFMTAVGALFLSLNVAPTEEMIMIAYRLSTWQEVLLALLSLSLMHIMVYRVEFAGSEAGPQNFWGVFARFTLVGYACVFLISLYVLWIFGRTDGVALNEILSSAIVLSFPGAIGAALARLIL